MVIFSLKMFKVYLFAAVLILFAGTACSLVCRRCMDYQLYDVSTDYAETGRLIQTNFDNFLLQHGGNDKNCRNPELVSKTCDLSVLDAGSLVKSVKKCMKLDGTGKFKIQEQGTTGTFTISLFERACTSVNQANAHIVSYNRCYTDTDPEITEFFRSIFKLKLKLTNLELEFSGSYCICEGEKCNSANSLQASHLLNLTFVALNTLFLFVFSM